VEKHHKKVQRLAEIKGLQLAEEEIKFLKAKEEQKLFNQWVSEQYHKKAVSLRKQVRYKKHLEKQEVLRQQLLKKEAELERRKETLRVIQFLADNKPESINETLATEDGELIRRKVIMMQRDHHKKLAQEAQKKKVERVAEVRKQLLEEKEIYLEDREAEWKDKKERKAKVFRKAQKKAWR